jgi:hypothetical protein
LRIRRRAVRRSGAAIHVNFIRAIHRTLVRAGIQVAHLGESLVGVTQIVVVGISVTAGCAQVNGAERNGLTRRIHSEALEVILRVGGVHGVAGTGAAVGRNTKSLKQIIRRAVFLEDDHHVLDDR